MSFFINRIDSGEFSSLQYILYLYILYAINERKNYTKAYFNFNTFCFRFKKKWHPLYPENDLEHFKTAFFMR